MNILPVVLAGGTGTRLWPLSRELHPKQFLAIRSEHSLLQETIFRSRKIPSVLDPIVVCNQEHRFLVAEQLREINCKSSAIILEPERRNTAPALALAAFESLSNNDDPLLLALPSDHVIEDSAKFHETITKSFSAAEKGKFVTFGVKPLNIKTRFGYVESGKSYDAASNVVKAFKEKPAEGLAKEFINDGWLWNSGIFLVKASVYLNLLEKYEPKVYESCKTASAKSFKDLDFIRVDKESFLSSPSISVDYGILEKTSDAVVVELKVKWDDLNSWSSLWDLLEKDSNGNVSKGDVTLLDTENSVVYSSERQVCTMGVKDLVVIETATSVLVADKGNVNQLKKLTELLKEQDRQELLLHRQVCRPWGKFDSVDSGKGYQVKRITVNPGEKLSKQMHYQRAEHWVVVSGTAKIIIDEKELILKENQSTYIPKESVHSLENPGPEPLKLIEVQNGSYLGEDDIVRFEDRYGRIEG